jgi:hypothetical protein
MAVAYNSTNTDLAYVFDYTNGGITVLSFPFNNVGGNAVCIMAVAYEDAGVFGTFSSITYNGSNFIQDWNQSLDYSGNPFEFYGGHLLNATTGTKTIVVTTGAACYDIKARVVSVSGASTSSITSFNNNNGESTTPIATNVTSATNNLVIGMAGVGSNDTPYSVLTLNGTSISNTSPIWASYYSGAASVSVSQTNNTLAGTGGMVGGWSFPPAGAGPTPIAKLGGRYVSNQVQTTPGNATGVVANAYNGDGNDVGGGGVVDVYTGVL